MIAANIIAEYGKADIRGRVVLIIKNYPNFIEMLDGYEHSLAVVIHDEKVCNKRIEKGDPGIRVSSTKLSDPVFDQVSAIVENEQAIRSADFESGFLRGTDRTLFFKRQIQTCFIMREDFGFFQDGLMALNNEERQIFQDYLSGRKSMQGIADAMCIGYDTARKKIRNYRRLVMDQTGFFMQLRDEQRRIQNESTVGMITQPLKVA